MKQRLTLFLVRPVLFTDEDITAETTTKLKSTVGCFRDLIFRFACSAATDFRFSRLCLKKINSRQSGLF
jgi:hypothetical protein